MTTLEEAKLKTLIAYTGYDPFAQNLPISQLDSGQARSNPSKQLQTIQRAMKESGGWWENVTTKWYYTVLSGPYTGQYIFKDGSANFSYEPIITPPLGTFWVAPGIEKLRASKLGDLLKLSTAMYRLKKKHLIGREMHLGGYVLGTQHSPLMRREGVAHEFLRSIHFPLGGRFLGDVKGFPRSSTGKESPSEAWKLLTNYQQEAWGPGYLNEIPPEFIEYWGLVRLEIQKYMPEAQRLELLYNHPEAQVMFILSRAAGVPVDQVVNAFVENPKRLLSVPSLRSVPTRMNDRVRYARALIRTWSVNKALQAIFPNIDGKIDKLFPSYSQPVYGEQQRQLPPVTTLDGVSIEPVRWAFNFIPSPSQLWAPGDTADQIRTAVRLFRAAGGRKSDWNALVARLRRQPEDFGSLLHSLCGTLITIPDIRHLLAQDLRGRKILEAAESPGPAWIHLLREQAYIDHLAETEWERESKFSAQEMQVFHEKGEKVLQTLFGSTAPIFPSGASIRSLKTQEDFKREGREMHHCVRGYFWKHSLIFAFRDSQGNRATLEWTSGNWQDLWTRQKPLTVEELLHGTANQFLGPRVLSTPQGPVCFTCKEPVYERSTPTSGEEPRVCGNIKPSTGSELAHLLAAFKSQAAKTTRW